MKAALHIPYFNYGTTESIAPALVKIVQKAEEVGFDTISVMDHYFQIHGIGSYTDPMLEAYTTLSFIAAHTKKVKLGTLVTGVIYREPAFLIKQVTTLDILSEGRAFFGVGAAWNEQEANALGFPFPEVKTRFQMLKETLEIAKKMWSGDTKPFKGKIYELPEPLNHPEPISKPHPKILIGGGGEQKTLLYVAKYADACNLFARAGIDEVKHKLDVLKQHCQKVGRDYNEIEKTVMATVDMSDESSINETIDQAKDLSSIGIEKIFYNLPGMQYISPLTIFGQKVIPQILDL